MSGRHGSEISLESVSFSWSAAGASLFRDVDMVFPSGRTICLIGPNGSGKTTLMELLLGWRKPESGRVILDGRPLSEMSSRERGRTMALVPQEERLPFSYTVLEYVMLGRSPHLPPLASPGALDRELGEAVLERVGIPQLAHRSVPRLSGGERRMVLIARALLQEPRILLLDEPANHLDPANRERVMGILASLKSSGITIIMSSHEPDMATRTADSIILLKAGSAPVIGSPEEMIEPDRLARLYGLPVRLVEAHGRRIILWGN